MRALCQKLSTENHQSGKQELSSARTAQREEPAREEEEPMLLQRPERARTLDELEELGREGCVENKELPRTAVEGLQLEKNLSNHIGAPKEKKRKEQMIDLQNLLTTKSPSVKSLAVPTTVQELVSRARVAGGIRAGMESVLPARAIESKVLCWGHMAVVERSGIVLPGWSQRQLNRCKYVSAAETPSS